MKRVWGSTAGTLLALVVLVGAAAGASTNLTEANSSPETVGAGPSDLVAGDWDDDGDNDLAVVAIAAGNVTILMNNGRGNFKEPATSPIPIGSFPNAIAAGDIDSDDDLDLIVAQQEGETLTILSNNGSGVFAPAATSPEPVESDAIDDVSLLDVVVANLDGEAGVDIAVATLPDTNPQTDNLAVLTNDGDGDFSVAASSPETAGNKPVSLAVGDMDADGDRDLVTANQQSFGVSVMRNNGAADLTALPEVSTGGVFPQSVTIARLNGNAAPDVAVANQGTSNVSIFRNTGNGDLALFNSSPETVGDTPFDVAAADFDLDGDRDLASADRNANTATILVNNGKGNFGEAGSSPETTGANPSNLVAAQFDTKPGADLAVVNSNASSVTIFRNR